MGPEMDVAGMAKAGSEKSEPGKKKAAVPAPPARMRLRRPFGFFDEAGAHHYWSQGEVVTDAAQIALLCSRGAFVDEVV